jgi:hypothetical protein
LPDRGTGAPAHEQGDQQSDEPVTPEGDEQDGDSGDDSGDDSDTSGGGFSLMHVPIKRKGSRKR